MNGTAKVMLGSIVAISSALTIIYPYAKDADDLKIVTQGEIFPDIHVTYNCPNELIDHRNEWDIKKQGEEYIVNYGFFRLHRGGKAIECK